MRGLEAARAAVDQKLEGYAEQFCRYYKSMSSGTALPVALGSADAMRRIFEAEHLNRFGFTSPEKRVFIATLEVEAAGGAAN